MRTLIRGMLEFLRMTVLLLFFMGIIGEMENSVIRMIIGREGYGNFRLGGNAMFLIGDLLLFMVFYRNYLQFRGWYTEEAERLPKRVTRMMLGFGFACILLPISIALLL
ncbi:hypothetical protein [Paenibacillus terrigena]|uniref:hypothetical protein n=1 Tax=Paenibacillus terrigena TaxID=369333 RepID=UPI0028D69ED9|nr:hypothetical protein [Paenibacillus terrigena]